MPLISRKDNMEEIELEHPIADPNKDKAVDKIEDMMVYAEPILQKYPKYARFNLVTDIVRCMDRMMEIAVEADKKYFKKTTLQSLDVEVERMRRYVRISLRLKYISHRTYRLWSEKVNEIGKMVGGWIKANYEKENKRK